MAKNYDPSRASVAVGGGRGRRKRGLLPLVLGLLTLLLLALAIGLLSCGGDGGEPDTDGAVAVQGIPGSPDPSEATKAPPSDAGASAGATGESGTTGGSGTSGATGESGTTGGSGETGETGGGTLTAGGASLLGQDAGSIQERVGEDAEGSGLRVLSVNESGFFVGSSERDRQFVEYAGDVGEDESDQQLPKVGDTVSLTGPVRPAPEDPTGTLKLDEAEARLVTERGAYINADTVEPAAG